MKKLMIALAAVAMATAVNAGSVAWSVANIQASPFGSYVSATPGPATQYSAWLFIVGGGTTVDSITTAILAGTDVTTSAVDSKVLTYGTPTANKMTMSSTQVAASTSYGDGDIVEAFLVIFDAASFDDAKYFEVAQKRSGNGSTTPYTYADTITQTFGQNGNKTFAFGTQETNQNGWQAVPEPTSGLLMLLGMAGLALRRRRA